MERSMCLCIVKQTYFLNKEEKSVEKSNDTLHCLPFMFRHFSALGLVPYFLALTITEVAFSIVFEANPFVKLFGVGWVGGGLDSTWSSPRGWGNCVIREMQTLTKWSSFFRFTKKPAGHFARLLRKMINLKHSPVPIGQ